MKRGYTVYRVDYVTGKREAIGCLLERRTGERGNNLLKLLVEARKLFAMDRSEAITIVLDSPADAKVIEEIAIGNGIVSIVSRHKGTREERP